MNDNRIKVYDILGSDKINANTPIIILKDVPIWYLSIKYNGRTPKKGIYYVDVDKLHNYLEKKYQYIHRFIPVGQVEINNRKKKTFDIMMANSNIVPTTQSYEPVDKDNWIGIIKNNNKTLRSLGTINSREKPTTAIPVFSESFLRLDENNYPEKYGNDIHTVEKYGKWTLDPYKFIIDRSHLQMINSTGNICNMVLPNLPKDIIDESAHNRDFEKNMTRKVYFTTQGSIVSDTNCNPTGDNMSKMSLNECNASAVSTKTDTNIGANDDGLLALNDTAYCDTVLDKKSKWIDKRKTVVLKEKDEPWFLDATIVGNVLHTTDPHKVTGSIRTIGTSYGSTDEINMPYKSDCVDDELSKGYSRADRMNKCIGKSEHFTDPDQTADQAIDSVDCKNTNYNNVIIYALCLFIIILLIYKRN
jgi:hypothetical protein